MKKIKRLLVVAALALIVGATAKVQTQAAVTGVKQIDDSKNSVKHKDIVLDIDPSQ